MRNNAILKEGNRFSDREEILKVTALLYLKDALLKEEYEDCQELVDSARNFGAHQSEINEVIAVYLREKEGGPIEANKVKSRLVIKGRP